MSLQAKTFLLTVEIRLVREVREVTIVTMCLPLLLHVMLHLVRILLLTISLFHSDRLPSSRGHFRGASDRGPLPVLGSRHPVQRRPRRGGEGVDWVGPSHKVLRQSRPHQSLRFHHQIRTQICASARMQRRFRVCGRKRDGDVEMVTEQQGVCGGYGGEIE